MIGISKLYCGTVEASDPLRYGRDSRRLPSGLLQFSADKKPVVVWNVTRACNLSCRHCYAGSAGGPAPDEMGHGEALSLADQLAGYGAPVVLFSGGEPLLRPGIFELMGRVVSKGSRAVLSSNGLLLTADSAKALKDLGLSYIGVSLDGLGKTHDNFRSCPGAFDKTVKNMRLARDAGLKTGLRLTLSRSSAAEIPAVFALMEREGIERACFYHLVPAGRGSGLSAETLSHAETRAAVDLIIDKTRESFAGNRPLEVLTVDNHADGPYLYLRLLREGRREQALKAMELLKMNGGNSSGLGIAAISWNGDVHPDQFWRNIVLGSVRNRPFADIWHDPENDFLQKLKNKKHHVTGRCRACAFLEICGGNLRARAEAATGGIWGEDPACYLSDEEIFGEKV